MINGYSERAWLEFEIIYDQVRRKPSILVSRLSRFLQQKGECKIWTGARHCKGYGKINFRYEGRIVQIQTHRLFLILMLKHPIPPGYQSGHYNCHDESCVVHVQLEETADNAKDANQRRAAKR